MGEARVALAVLLSIPACQVFAQNASDLALRRVAELCEALRSGENVQLRDADAAVQVVSGKIGKLDWGGVKRRGVACVVRDLSAIGEIDCILGYPMVARRHISLNYVRRELCCYCSEFREKVLPLRR